MIRNEIGCCNRWGRYAFRWRTYRSMMHSLSCLKEQGCWNGYNDLKKLDSMCSETL